MSINLPTAIQHWPLERLKPYERNARTHGDAQVAKIAASIAEFGFTNPILVDSGDGIIAGHGRLMAAKQLGLSTVPVIVLDHLTDAQRRAYIIADNRLALDAGWDEALLAEELAALQVDGFDLELTGFTDDELDDLLADIDPANDNAAPSPSNGEQAASMADRFLVPPFSVLNAREGWWQSRKRAWLDMGIRSELGRGDNMLGFSDAANRAMTGAAYPASASKHGKTFGAGLTSGTGSYAAAKAATKGGFGKCLETGIGEQYGREEMNGTSIFDPVLCEIAYRWFCPAGGVVVDPFAGGSVRGIVASKLGRQYLGCELRAEQVAANRAQADELLPGAELVPVWHCGDSRNITSTMTGVQADFVFSCPPYADLEVYSDDPADLSTLDYPAFRDAYFQIVARTCELLKPDRFACFVVGEVRDKRGHYYDFVGDTVEAFRMAGLAYYNEAILVTAVGSLPIRAGKQFSASRKLGKTHQQVLVFVKGDSKRAAEACGEVDVSLPEGMDDAA